MKSESQTLKDLINRADSFVARRASLAAEREKIVAGADLTLDIRVGERLAAIDATLSLADQQEGRILSEASVWSSKMLQASVDIQVEHQNAEVAVRESILRRTPEDARDGLDVVATRAYRSEMEQRWLPSSNSYSVPGFGKSLTVTLEQLRVMHAELSKCEAETTRCRNLVRKLAA